MANDLTATYDYASSPDVADVRFEILDLDVVSSPPTANPNDRTLWSCLFTDQEIQRRIDKNAEQANAIDLAAADLLDFMASNQAILAKLITLGSYTSDTRSTAKGLRDHADELRARMGKSAMSGGEEPAEAITEEGWTEFDSRRRRTPYGWW